MKNCAFLIGRLGNDPKLNKTASGKSVVTFSLGVDIDSKENKTFWANCKAWDKKADAIYEYLKKGSFISIAASLDTEKFKTKDDIDVEKTVFNVSSFSFLEKKSKSQSTDDFMDNGEDDVATF